MSQLIGWELGGAVICVVPSTRFKVIDRAKQNYVTRVLYLYFMRKHLTYSNARALVGPNMKFILIFESILNISLGAVHH